MNFNESRMVRGSSITLAVACVLLFAPPLLAAGGGEDGAHPPFLPLSLLWAIAAFLVVLFVLTKKLLPPILSAMDKRALEIRESLDAAERARAEAEELMSRHQADMEKARAEAAAVIDQGRADAQRLRDSIVETAEKQAQEVTERAVRAIEQAKLGAVEELRSQVAEMSLDIASRLIRKNLTPEDQKQLIEDRLRDFPSA